MKLADHINDGAEHYSEQRHISLRQVIWQIILLFSRDKENENIKSIKPFGDHHHYEITKFGQITEGIWPLHCLYCGMRHVISLRRSLLNFWNSKINLSIHRTFVAEFELLVCPLEDINKLQRPKMQINHSRQRHTKNVYKDWNEFEKFLLSHQTGRGRHASLLALLPLLQDGDELPEVPPAPLWKEPLLQPLHHGPRVPHPPHHWP